MTPPRHIRTLALLLRQAGRAEEQRNARLTFHKLHGEKFLRLMASSRGVACTAGFESVSEAAYLGKPLLMVPVEIISNNSSIPPMPNRPDWASAITPSN